MPEAELAQTPDSSLISSDGDAANGVRIVTMGCRLNAYESEAMRKLAAEGGAQNAVIVNTCAVTNEAVRQARQAIRRARRENPDASVIVTGCAAQIDPQAFDRFSITAAPTFVLLKAGAVAAPCAAGTCFPASSFVAAAGDVSIDYALEYFRRAAPSFSRDAGVVLATLKKVGP